MAIERARWAHGSRTSLFLAITAVAAMGVCPGCAKILGIEPGVLRGGPDAALPDATPVESGVDAGPELGGDVEAESGSPAGPASGGDAAADSGVAEAAIAGGPFTISLDGLSRVTIVRGTSTEVTVSIVAAGGSVGPVSITTGPLPSGVSADALSIPATATTGTLTLNAATSAALTVDATLQIVGTTPAFTNSVDVPLYVQDPAGTLDVTFGTKGIATVPLAGEISGTGSAIIGNQGLALQPDGSIVYCGNAPFGSGAELIVGRLTPDGILDSSFASGGLLAMNEPGHFQDVCHAVRALPTGALVVGGFSAAIDNPHAFFAARFTAQGLPDTTFGSGTGFVSTQFVDATGVGLDSKAYDLALQSDGRLVLAGYSGSTPTLLRLMPDGTTDLVFGSSGVAQSALSGAITGVAVLPGGDLLTPISSASFLAAQFSPSGSIDTTSFGEAGYATASAAAPLITGGAEVPASGALGIAVQPDGKSVLAGATTPSGEVNGAIALARLDADGQLDTSFGQEGLVLTAIPGGNATAGAVAMTQDGGFAVCASLPTSTPIGVVRYDARGALDTDFAGIGYTGIPGTTQGEAIAVDAAGRIVLGAFVTDSVGNNARVVIARFWP